MADAHRCGTLPTGGRASPVEGGVCSDEPHVECLAERDTSLPDETVEEFESEVKYMVHGPTGVVPFRQEDGYPLR